MTRPARWIVAAALLLTAGGAALRWGAWEAAALTRASQLSGWVAAALLLGSLAASPLGWGLDRALVKRWRRALGVGAAAMALAHLGLALAGPLRDALAALWAWPTYRAGLLATLVLVLLAITSHPATARRVRVWKPLHRLAYAAGALVLLHLLRLPFASVVGVTFFGSALGLLLLWRLALRLRGGPRGSRPAPGDRRSRS